MKFVILCSAHGTVMDAVLQSIKKGELTAECLGLITDSAERGCTEKAKAFGLPVTIVIMQKGELRAAYDADLDAAIATLAGGRDIIVACMGWRWILSPAFVTKYRNRILNVHPALLPKHPGSFAHDKVLAAKDTESGMTIHIIDEGVDTGKILLQKSCPVVLGDTAETLKKRVQELECTEYPRVLQMIETGELKLPS